MNDKMTIVPIPLDMLEPHPDNPRKDLGDLTELADSIKTNGIMQNLTVVAIPDSNKYRVVIGHRRMAAAKLAGITELPCVVSDMDHKEQVATMLAENMQRSDLTVYEQAWGFQQMTILGCSVEEISSKSGFSQSTVRRRLKIAELDKKTLKDVSERQLSLADFDRLNEIGSMSLRNAVLKKIGTSDFNEALENAKKKERVDAKMPIVKEWLKAHNAKQLDTGETYGTRYTSNIGCGWYSYISIEDFGTKNGKKLPADKDLDGKQLYYTLNGDRFSLYVENPNIGSGSRGKKTEKEKARDRTMREVRAKVRELSELHYRLRKDFIEKLSVSKQNKEAIVAGALLPALYFAHCSGGNHSLAATEILGIREHEYHSDIILKRIDAIKEADYAKAVYAVYNDSAENWFACDMQTPATIPSYESSDCNILLHLLYRWLISIGYEPSTEEQSLMDGTHEVYHRGGKK